MGREDELSSGKVLRLCPTGESFPPSSRKASPAHFEPSSEEKAIAENSDRSVLVSVFDLSRTTVSQARGFHRRGAMTLPFWLCVEEIRKIIVPGRSESLRVLRDPLEPPLRERPGADGHCGILGLGRVKGEPSANRKVARSKLADMAQFLEEGSDFFLADAPPRGVK
jgi:hypothetical protein